MHFSKALTASTLLAISSLVSGAAVKLPDQNLEHGYGDKKNSTTSSTYQSTTSQSANTISTTPIATSSRICAGCPVTATPSVTDSYYHRSGGPAGDTPTIMTSASSVDGLYGSNNNGGSSSVGEGYVPAKSSAKESPVESLKVTSAEGYGGAKHTSTPQGYVPAQESTPRVAGPSGPGMPEPSPKAGSPEKSNPQPESGSPPAKAPQPKPYSGSPAPESPQAKPNEGSSPAGHSSSAPESGPAAKDNSHPAPEAGSSSHGGSGPASKAGSSEASSSKPESKPAADSSETSNDNNSKPASDTPSSSPSNPKSPSAEDDKNDKFAPAPIMTIGGSAVMASKVHNGEVIGSITLSPNGPAATINGQVVSAEPTGEIKVEGVHTYAVNGKGQAVVDVDGTAVTAVETGGSVVIGSKTLVPGGPAVTISGEVVSVARGGAIVVSSSVEMAIPSATAVVTSATASGSAASTMATKASQGSSSEGAAGPSNTSTSTSSAYAQETKSLASRSQRSMAVVGGLVATVACLFLW